MKKRFAAALALSLALSLCACGSGSAAPTGSSDPDPTENTGTAASPTETESLSAPEGWFYVTVDGENILTDGNRAKEPEPNITPESVKLSDFGEAFAADHPVERDEYTLLPGTELAVAVTHIKGAEAGKTLYIVSGIHGDERAGWYAGTLLKEISIRSGELYVIAPANVKGARNYTRYVSERQDLNRSFPGDAEGNEAERVAAAIYQDIAEKKPDQVLDLHEAIMFNDKQDFLGSTLIFTELTGMEDLYLDLLFATQDGTICHNKYSQSGPGPAGSINAEVTRGLNIPVITVETFRGFDMQRRVSDQLDIVQFVLSYLGLR